MRYVSFYHEGRVRPGILNDDTIAIIDCETLIDYIALPAAEREERHTNESISFSDVTLAAPVHPPKNIFCVGRNYLEHAREGARALGRELKLPSVPTFFTKATTAIAAPDSTLHLEAAVSSEYDYEAELAVVIGSECKNVSPDDALHAVFGYTAFNDVT